MKDIYQRIWDADQSENGIRPILETESGDASEGYVKVSSSTDSNDRDLRVLPEVVIPEHKKDTYQLCTQLFDNYALAERDEELDTAQEREEVHDLIEAMVDTAPMQVARDYISEQTGTSLSKERFYNTLTEMWFRRFSMGGDPHLTGFEHVVVGEQQGAKAQGYHFWYKYYLDDGFAREVDGINTDAFPGLDNDRIVYLGSKMSEDQKQYPESVTISFKWDAADYDRQAIRPLTKPIGGFFVGCSVEGLLALGTVRAHKGINAPKTAIINGAEYEMKLFHSHSGNQVRTFYPKFKRGVEVIEPIDVDTDEPQGVASTIKIIASMVNPEHHDEGKESVTLINTGTSSVPLAGWKIMDKNKKRSMLDTDLLQAGHTYRFVLDGKGAQLSNKGGSIKLLNAQDHVAHMVSYSKNQVRKQAATIIF